MAPTLVPLDQGWDGAAAQLLAVAAGDEASAAAAIAAARADGGEHLFGSIEGDDLVAAYLMVKRGMANEVTLIAVDPGLQGEGLGRACLRDALARSGKRPLVVEGDAQCRDFYAACGFKLVGKRPQSDGTVRYRLGWHAPRPSTGTGGEA